MNTFWSTCIRGLEPYVPGEQPKTTNLIKLNTNENPYPPSPAVLNALKSAANADLRLYPDPEGRGVKEAVADLYGFDPASIFLGNGSDEVLAHVFYGLLKHERPILFPDITYSFYPVYCALYGIECEPVPLDDQFRVNIPDYSRPNGGIVLPNPNAPTGIPVTSADIRALLEQNPDSVIVIDEAYVDFGAESAVSLIDRYPNLLVVQTLSKSRALAGLRVSFALGHPGLIQALDRVKNCFNSYPLDRLALAGARAAIQDTAYFDETRLKIMDNRKWLAEQLTALGFEVLPSAANFLFVRHGKHRAEELQQALREKNILVRHFSKPRINNFLRISIGTADQCRTLVDTLSSLV